MHSALMIGCGGRVSGTSTPSVLRRHCTQSQPRHVVADVLAVTHSHSTPVMNTTAQRDCERWSICTALSSAACSRPCAEWWCTLCARRQHAPSRQQRVASCLIASAEPADSHHSRQRLHICSAASHDTAVHLDTEPGTSCICKFRCAWHELPLKLLKIVNDANHTL